jgi:hypothetical protein
VALASACGAPRVSLFWSAAASGGRESARRDPLAGLVRDAKAELLRRGVAHAVAETILAPARALEASPVSPPAGGGLGLLASETEVQLLRLPYAVEAGAWVSGRYRVSPLVPLVQSDGPRATAAARRIVGSLGTGRASLDLSAVLRHARAGGLVLLVAALDINVWGTFDELGRVETHASRRPDDEELVDLAVAYALGRDTETYVVPRREVPGRASVAALIRM